MSTYYGPQPKRISQQNLRILLDAANPKSYPGSGLTWTDISGNQNQGTLTGGPVYSTANMGVITFDGVNDYTTFSNITQLNFGTDSFSCAFWIYPTAWADGTSRGILDKKTNDTTNGWVIYNDGAGGRQNKINARLGLQNNFPSTTNVTTNTWQQWVFVRSPSNLFWYLNGVLDATGAANGTTVTDSAVFDVGRSKTWGGWFKGNMGQVAIYNRALDSSEILELYQSTRGRYNQL